MLFELDSDINQTTNPQEIDSTSVSEKEEDDFLFELDSNIEQTTNPQEIDLNSVINQEEDDFLIELDSNIEQTTNPQEIDLNPVINQEEDDFLIELDSDINQTTNPQEIDLNSVINQEEDDFLIELDSDIKQTTNPQEIDLNPVINQEEDDFLIELDSDINQTTNPQEIDLNSVINQEEDDFLIELDSDIDATSDSQNLENENNPLFEQNNGKISIPQEVVEYRHQTSLLLEDSIKDLEKLLKQEVEPILQESQATSSIGLEPSITSDKFNLEQLSKKKKSGFRLILDQNNFFWYREESILIAGKVEIDKPFSNLNTISKKLRYELRNPQNSQTLLIREQLLPEQNLPILFSYSLDIPHDLQIHLILGEVILESAFEQPQENQNSEILASHSFSITANVNELLKVVKVQENKIKEDIDTEIEVEQELSASSESLKEEKKQATPLHLNLFDVTKRKNANQKLQSSSNQILPPKIKRSDSTEKIITSPELPEFVQKTLTTSTSETNQFKNEINIANIDKQLVEENDNLFEQNNENKEIKQQKNLIEEHLTITESELLSETTNKNQHGEIEIANVEIKELTDIEHQPSKTINSQPIASIKDIKPQIRQNEVETDSLTPENSDSSEIDQTFQSLKSEERFFSRLNSFAIETDTFEWVDDESSELLDDESQANTEFIEITDNFDAEAELIVEIDSEQKEEQEETEEQEESISSLVPETSSSPNPDSDNWQEIIASLEAEDQIALPEEFDDFEKTIEELMMSEEDLDRKEETSENYSNQVESDFTAENWSLESDISEEQSSLNIAADLTSLEVVVDDEDVLQPEVSQSDDSKYDASGLPYPQQTISSKRKFPITSQQQLDILVPAPILTIRNNELMAGETVVVYAKLPPYEGSVYIKLWVQDRQTRSLLDGPRTLVELDTNKNDELETMTQINIPFGTMEIRFEAIAIDTETQRESHKVAVDRIVIPPDLSEISLDDSSN